MKSRIFLITSVTLMVVLAFAASSFAAITITEFDTDLVTGGIQPPAATTVAANDSVRIGAFVVTGAAADVIGTITINQVGGAGLAAADVSNVSVYEDINKNASYDVGVDQYVGKAATVATWQAGTAVAIDVADYTFAGTASKYYVVVVATNKTGLTDGNVGTTSFNVNAVGAVPGTNGTTVAIVATHLKFDTTGTTLALQAAATNNTLTTGVSFLKAVDDYGNLDINNTETIVLSAVNYNTGADATAAMTATSGVAGGTSVKGAGQAMVAGEIDVNTGGAANEMFALSFTPAANYIVVATSQTTKLEGSVMIRAGAYTTVTGVLTTRGIEFYDTNHNGKLDALTIFFDAPIDINGTLKGAFGVVGYTVATDPVVGFDAGGVGIRNGGEYGVSMTLTEKSTYDTGAKPQVTYNAAVGALQDKNLATAVPQIVATTAVEVDKARPVLVSSYTRDTDATADGKIDSIVMTFSENVTGVSAATGLISVVGDLQTPKKSFGLNANDQNVVPTAVTLASASVTDNVVTLVVNETIPNTGILPVVNYVNNSGTNPAETTVKDFATAATGAAAANAFVTIFTSYAENLGAVNVKDGASPIITDVTTVDSGPNGRIDKITVTFSENMNTNALYTYGAVTFYSNLASFKSKDKADYTYVTTAGAATNNQIQFSITEAATSTYDTEATPIFRYNKDAADGNLFDANGFELATYTETGGGGRVQEVATFDGAAPVVVKKQTGDNKAVSAYIGGKTFDSTTPNGRLDTMVLEFSEEIATGSMDGGLSATELDALIAQFALTVPALTLMTADPLGASYDADAIPTLVHTTATDSKSVLTLYHQEQSFAAGGLTNYGDTGVTPSVAYVLGAAADQIKDKNAVLMAAFGAAAATDKAKPIVVNGLVTAYAGTGFSNLITMDRNAITFGADYLTGDGYLDSYEIRFSETVKMAGVDSVAVPTYFTVDNDQANGWSTITLSSFDIDMDGDVNKAANGDTDTSDATAGLAGFNTAYIYGTSNKPKDKWDTGRTPTVKYLGGSDIKDSAGNLLMTFGPQASYDGAKPVAVLAVGAVATDEIKVIWSEQPFSDAAGATSFAAVNGNAVFGYADGNAAGVSALAATAISLSGNNMTVKTTGTLSLADVESDSVWVKFTTVVFDNADAVFTALAENEVAWNTAGVGYKIIINDIIAPWITKAWSVDADGDGKVDHIRFEFSELIDDSSLAGYVSTDAMTADVSATWQLAGYTGMAKWNLFDGVAPSDATKLAANAAGMPVFNDNDVDDNVLYLWLEEDLVPVSTSGMGSTDYAPVATIVSPTLSDNKPNVLDVASTEPGAFKSGDAVTDKAGPVLMAAQTISSTVLRATFSEALKTSTATTADFSWTVGTSYSGYQGFVETVTYPSSGVVDLRVGPQNAFSADVGGSLAYASSIEDNLGTSSQAGPVSGSDAYAASIWYKADKTVDAAPGTVAASKTITVAATTIPAPASLAIADVPDDNGYWMMATFAPVAHTDVTHYQFYIQEDDDSWTRFAIASTPFVLNADGNAQVLVPTPVSGVQTYAVAAATGTVLGGTTAAAKAAGDVAVAVLVDGAAKPADTGIAGPLSDPVVGGAIDNIAPTMLAVYAAGDAAGNAKSIEVAWTPQADHGVVGTTNLFPIYGVNQYNVYRNDVLVGTAPALSSTFIDETVPAYGTVYQYKVELIDGNVEHAAMTSVRSALATSDKLGDLNGDLVVESSDFAIFAANYGKSMAANPTTFISAADYMVDGVIESSDFAIFAANYGTSAKVAKMSVDLPMSTIGMSIATEMDAATSMMYVSVSADDVQNLMGFALNLTYNTDALEFVENSVNGTVGLQITRNIVADEYIHIADMFIGEQFSGTVTLGFKVKGSYDELSFEIPNGSVYTGENYEEMGINSVESTYKVAPSVYALSKNYPNPFNPTTTIDYSIPQAGNVELVIYNTAGQKIRTLINQMQDASFYKVVWDGRDESGQSVASGIYFYRLVAGNFSKIEKMTLIK